MFRREKTHKKRTDGFADKTDRLPTERYASYRAFSHVHYFFF